MAKTKNVAQPPSAEAMDSQTLAVRFAKLAQDRNAENIIVLDLRGISPITDYFVIGTGTSGRQISALADELESLGKELGNKLWKSAGRSVGDWVVLDFVDIVVHLFNQDLRKHYDLELIWGEAPRVDWTKK
jgi:ribosome-associated protein